MSSTPIYLSNISNISDTISGTTPEIFPPVKEALDEGRTVRAWMKVQESKSRLKHLKNLRDEVIGLNVDEHYLRKTNNHRKAGVSHGMRSRRVISASMDMRIRDERANLKELKEQQNEARKALGDCFGRGTMKYRQKISKLNRMTRMNERRDDHKHDKQLQHLSQDLSMNHQRQRQKK